MPETWERSLAALLFQLLYSLHMRQALMYMYTSIVEVHTCKLIESIEFKAGMAYGKYGWCRMLSVIDSFPSLKKPCGSGFSPGLT